MKQFHINGMFLSPTLPHEVEEDLDRVICECVDADKVEDALRRLNNLKVGEFTHFQNVGTVIRLADSLEDNERKALARALSDLTPGNDVF